MNDTSFVSGFQRFSDLLRYRQGFIDRDGPPSNAVSKGRPLDQLQYQRASIVSLFETVDSRNVRMVQTGEDLGLSLEPSESVRVSRERLGEDLECDSSVELGVGGLVDLPHAAFANEGGHVVVRDAGANV